MALMLDTNFYIGVVVAAVVSFVIGGIWFARPVFGKMWLAALGRSEADMEAMRKQAPKGFVTALISNFISAFVLAVFLSYAGSATPGYGGALLVGFLVWLGFIVTMVAPAVIFEGRSINLVGINLGYALVSYLVMGVLLRVWITG